MHSKQSKARGGGIGGLSVGVAKNQKFQGNKPSLGLNMQGNGKICATSF